MARPLKRGLDYFPLSCDFDDSIKLIEAKHGYTGFGIYIKLLQKIHKYEGYYMICQEKNLLLFAKECGISLSELKEIIDTCFEEGVFDKGMYDSFKILTSVDIQKTWFKIVTDSKRKETDIESKYNLIQLTPDETPLTPEENPQSKVNETKPNEKIEEKIKTENEIALSDFFENALWPLVPNKKGKQKAFLECKKALDEILEANPKLDAKKDVLPWFLKRYKDYLTNNKLEAEVRKSTPTHLKNLENWFKDDYHKNDYETNRMKIEKSCGKQSKENNLVIIRHKTAADHQCIMACKHDLKEEGLMPETFTQGHEEYAFDEGIEDCYSFARTKGVSTYDFKELIKKAIKYHKENEMDLKLNGVYDPWTVFKQSDYFRRAIIENKARWI